MDNLSVPARTPRGRRSRLNPALVDQLCALLRAGNFIEAACGAVGLGVTTFHRWMREAEEPDASDELRQFRLAVKRARAEAEVEALRHIQAAAARGTWQAAAWFLERSYPERWGRRRTFAAEFSGPHQESVKPTCIEEAVEIAMAAFGRTTGADPNAARP